MFVEETQKVKHGGFWTSFRPNNSLSYRSGGRDRGGRPPKRAKDRFAKRRPLSRGAAAVPGRIYPTALRAGNVGRVVLPTRCWRARGQRPQRRPRTAAGAPPPMEVDSGAKLAEAPRRPKEWPKRPRGATPAMACAHGGNPSAQADRPVGLKSAQDHVSTRSARGPRREESGPPWRAPRSWHGGARVGTPAQGRACGGRRSMSARCWLRGGSWPQ